MPVASTQTCPICGEPAPLLRAGYAGYRAPQTFDIHECDKCDLQFAWPFRSDANVYDAIYQQPERLSGYDRYLRLRDRVRDSTAPLKTLSDAESMYWFIADRVAALDPDRTSNMLEVGCGLGYLTHALRKAGHDIKGLDISANAVETAKQIYGPYYICADVNVFPATSDERFDIIVMTEVIEHLEDPLAVLRSLRTLLKPGGVALISTPAKDYLPQSAVWRTDNPPVHLAWYSKTSLREMARRTNFRVSFADFRGYNAAKVAALGKPRDLATGVGVFRLSPDNKSLDKLIAPRAESVVYRVLPDLRRLERRRKYVRRALELYAEQSDVIGVILQRDD